VDLPRSPEKYPAEVAMTPDLRAVEAVANAIDAALDTWDADHGPRCGDALADSHAIADAIIKLLPQFGYDVYAIRTDDPANE
jgi:hypothetical protein